MNRIRFDGKVVRESVYGKMGLVFLIASVVSVVIFLTDNRKELPKNEKGESVVERNEYGKGKREEEYAVRIGEKQEVFQLVLQERKYTESELQTIFMEAQNKLQELILGENQSLDEVRHDLNLITVLPDSGLEVSWSLDNYHVMNMTGQLKSENLSQDGTLVRLTALLMYGEETCEYQFYANVFAPVLSDDERMLRKLQEEIEKCEDLNDTEKEIALPNNIAGEKVEWDYVTDYRAGGVFLLGLALGLFVYVSEDQRKKDEKKRREKQLAYDYPQLLNKFTLYIKAGMTVKNAWYRIAEDYELQKSRTGAREAYEEMVKTMQEMKSGAGERECYEKFGERCGLPIYRKFGAMLSQNLKKGTKGMTVLLNQEAISAFEERKNMAKKLGEEAGTKMMLPMFLMLAVVLVMIIVPAFVTVQI